jgi:hypothetical protein
MAIHINQFANISRERRLSNRLKGFPVCRRYPSRRKGSSSFMHIFKLLKQMTEYFMELSNIAYTRCKIYRSNSFINSPLSE